MFLLHFLGDKNIILVPLKFNIGMVGLLGCVD